MCIYQVFLHHPSVDGHIGWFHILAIVNGKAINVYMQLFLWYVFQIFAWEGYKQPDAYNFGVIVFLGRVKR